MSTYGAISAVSQIAAPDNRVSVCIDEDYLWFEYPCLHHGWLWVSPEGWTV